MRKFYDKNECCVALNIDPEWFDLCKGRGLNFKGNGLQFTVNDRENKVDYIMIEITMPVQNDDGVLKELQVFDNIDEFVKAFLKEQKLEIGK